MVFILPTFLRQFGFLALRGSRGWADCRCWLAILLLSAVPSAAFPKGVDSDEPKLIGTWRYLTQAEDYFYTLDLRADGTFVIFIRTSVGATISLSGRWSCRNKLLHFIYERSTVPYNKPKDPNARDQLLAVTDTTLTVIEYGEGGRKVYRRLNAKGD
jgi:hypothetical protein